MNPQRVDLIWNITRLCPWHCTICCVDADPLNVHRQEGGPRELDYREKLSVLDNLRGFVPKIDISGGDPLAVPDALPLIEECSKRFGADGVTLTATGTTLRHLAPEFAARHIGEINITYDMPDTTENDTRPRGYSTGNLSMSKRFLDVGLRLRAECPLTTRNVAPRTVQRIFLDLHDAGIQTLLITRMFPVGRGDSDAGLIPSADQYRLALSSLRELEADRKLPKIRLQCALRFFDDSMHGSNPCDLVRLSLGIMPDGTLLTSPWAYGRRGQPLDDVWVLGNLALSPLHEILASEKAQYYREHLDDNFGHCKVFSWLHSKRAESLERVFDTSDPLLIPP